MSSPFDGRELRLRPAAHRALSVAILAILAAVTPAVVEAQAPPPFRYFNSFTITGDYVVAGVDLPPQSAPDGTVTGTIQVSGVPRNADVVAAYLYWETIWSGSPATLDALNDKVRFRGQPVSAVKSSTVPLVGPYSPCWSNGGDNLTMMRADVRRLLPPQLQEDTTENGVVKLGQPTGKRVVNHAELQQYQGQFPGDDWLLTVTLPEAGTGNQLPQSAGASLLIIYRDPDSVVTPLRTVVVYDGVHLQAPGESTTQAIGGFLQSSGADARITHVGGSGAPNDSDRVLFNGSLVPNGTNAFRRAGGGTSDRAWSNPTFPVGSLMPGTDGHDGYGEQVTTTVDHLSASPYDCLSWAAIVFSTTVQDIDDDGLVDRLEQTSGLRDPANMLYPDIAGMGAVVGQKDLFVEIGAMYASSHDHMPSASVLKQVGDALADGGVAVHFDVGPVAGAAYTAFLQSNADPADDDYIVLNGANGGEKILEQPSARFPGYSGVVSWPTGFQMYVNAPVGAGGEEVTNTNLAACEGGGALAPCRRRFDLSRQGIFHYVLYVHARGLPKSADPNDPDFHVPRSASGVAEIPGRYAMVSLGLWDDMVGSEFMQASTTLHELGHNFGLWHGGDEPLFVNLPNGRANVFTQPNCKPTYFSSMSYVFQATGVVDTFGVARIRYSNAAEPALSEPFLTDETLATPFRPAWYAPLEPGTLGVILGVPAATKHCNGTLLTAGDPAVGMGRLDAPLLPSLNWKVDWDGDGLVDGAAQDVNFDGAQTGPLSALTGFDDWSSLRLNQVGAGRNMLGFSLGLDFGGLDFGGLDFGGLDFGGLDFGGLDFGGLDFGGLDFGGLDFGGLDFGGLDFGGLDFGGLDFGGLDFGGTELDFDALRDVGGTPPSQLDACVLGGSGADACDPADNAPLHRHRLNWVAPNVGTEGYSIHRAWDPTGVVTSSSVVQEVGTAPAAATGFVDVEELPNGQTFIYWIKGSIGGVRSGPSNFATVVAENAAPVAVDDDYSAPQGGPLVVAAAGVLANDTDVDSQATSLTAILVSGPMGGTLVFNGDGSFTYSPNPGFAGTDTFTYKVNNGTWRGNPAIPMSADSNIATVSITVTPTLAYGFAPARNLPPRQPVNAGSSVPLEWAFTVGGVAVDSSNARPLVTIIGPAGTQTFAAEDPGSSSFHPPTGPKWTWQFNWQTVAPGTGAPLPKGQYLVTITSRLTGQTFNGGTITLK